MHRLYSKPTACTIRHISTAQTLQQSQCLHSKTHISYAQTLQTQCLYNKKVCEKCMALQILLSFLLNFTNIAGLFIPNQNMYSYLPSKYFYLCNMCLSVIKVNKWRHLGFSQQQLYLILDAILSKCSCFVYVLSSLWKIVLFILHTYVTVTVLD